MTDAERELLEIGLKLASATREIDLEGIIRQIEATAIRQALEATNGDIEKASMRLGYRTKGALEFVMRRHGDLTKEKEESAVEMGVIG